MPNMISAAAGLSHCVHGLIDAARRLHFRTEDSMHKKASSIERHVLLDGGLPQVHDIKSLLSAGGINYRLASGWGELFSASASTQAQHVVLVLSLPCTSGSRTRFCMAMSHSDALREMPILVVGRSISPDVRVQCFRAGASDFIDDGAKPEEIYRKILVQLLMRDRQCYAAREEGVVMSPRSRVQDVYSAASLYLALDETFAISREELARRVGVTPSELDSAFRQITGHGVVRSLRERRMIVASKLLSASSLSVTHIAEMLEFSGSANFATAFRQLTGTTPSQYREASQGACSYRDGDVCDGRGRRTGFGA